MPSEQDKAEVSHEEAQELISEWRANARQYGSHQRETFNARCETYALCADALEELIEGE